MPKNEPTKQAVKFRGLRTAHDAKEIGLDGLLVADNVDLTMEGRLRRRKGRSRRYSGVLDSAWCDDELLLVTSGSSLLRLDENWSSSLVRSDLTTGGQITACRLDDAYFYSNGFQTGAFRSGAHGELGIAIPSAPSVAATAGALAPGRYQIAITYRRSDGQQSGASEVRTIELSSTGGIALSGIPTSLNTAVTQVVIYMTAANGTVLRRTATVSIGTSNLIITAEQLFEPLQTQFMAPPPPFEIAEFYGSRMLYVSGEFIYYSLKFGYELVDVRSNFVMMPGRITMIATTPTGIYVASDKKTWFLSCEDIAEIRQMKDVADYGAHSRTRVYVDGELIGIDGVSGTTPVWHSKQGVCAGLDGGVLRNLTQQNVVMSAGTTGTAMFRQQDGQNHFISVIR